MVSCPGRGQHGITGQDIILSHTEASELQSIMLARRANIVRNQIIVRDLVSLLGVIPKVTDILDQLATVIHLRFSVIFPVRLAQNLKFDALDARFAKVQSKGRSFR
jgi:hypothetical protein